MSFIITHDKFNRRALVLNPSFLVFKKNEININMLSLVVFFGFITTTFGTNSSVLPSTNVTASFWSSTATQNTSTQMLSPSIRLSTQSEALLSVTASFWSSTATQNTLTQMLSPSITLSTQSEAQKTQAATETMSTVIKTSQITKKPSKVKESETGTTTISRSSKQTPNKTLLKRISSTPTTFSVSATLGIGTSAKPSKTATEEVFWWHVTTGTLKYLFYGSIGVTILCIILLIFVCCCWRRQARTLKKLQRQDTILSNLHSERNNHIVGFPSPLQLDTFIVKPESPYDMPEQVEHPSEEIDISYITVVDGNESDSQYAAVKENGKANSIADSESRDDDSQLSPAYTNASVFENDPYQQLMLDNRSNEDHYTSLITRDENNQENEPNEATV